MARKGPPRVFVAMMRKLQISPKRNYQMKSLLAHFPIPRFPQKEISIRLISEYEERPHMQDPADRTSRPTAPEMDTISNWSEKV